MGPFNVQTTKVGFIFWSVVREVEWWNYLNVRNVGIGQGCS
jgi:hypothetical protein